MATGQDDGVETHEAEFTVTVKHLRVFELRANVTGFMLGGLEDWPAHIQDVIYAAMERVVKKARIKSLDVIQSRCGRDDTTEPYHVIVTCCESKGGLIINGRRS